MALDRVAINLNVNGKPIDYISEADWGLPLEKIYSQNMHRIFCIVQVPREWLPKLKEWMAPVGFSKILGPMGEPLPDPIKYRDRAVVCDLAEVGRAVGIPDLQAKVQSTTEVVPLVNGLELSMDLFKDSMMFDPTGKILDLNSISDGPCTVGAAMNYATWATFGSDVIDLTGGKAIVATQQTATTETAQCAINKALGGGSITLTSAVNPKGNFGAGYLSTSNLETGHWFSLTCSSASSGAIIKLSNLNLKYLTGHATVPKALVVLLSTTSNITNFIIDSVGNLGGFNCNGFAGASANGCVFRAYNCIVANGKLDATTGGYGFAPSGTGTDKIYENCTVYSCRLGFWNYSNIAVVFKNCAAFNTVLAGYAYTYLETPGLGNSSASKCASSDTTGSEAGLRSLVAANQFQSLTLADGDPFLKLKTGSALAGAGVAPSIAANIYGTRGNTRPHSGLYSIGADEYNVAPYAHILARRRGM